MFKLSFNIFFASEIFYSYFGINSFLTIFSVSIWSKKSSAFYIGFDNWSLWIFKFLNSLCHTHSMVIVLFHTVKY